MQQLVGVNHNTVIHVMKYDPLFHPCQCVCEYERGKGRGKGLNPLSPNSVQDQFSPYNIIIHTL